MDRRYAKRMARYWAHMESASLNTFSRLDINSWFDHWHMHPDRDAKGNKRQENRIEAARLGYKLLMVAERALSVRPGSVQCFATFCDDTRDNAVFIHSENPNGSTYPLVFPGIDWGNQECEFLNVLVDAASHRIGKMTQESNTYFVVMASGAD